MSNTNKKFIPLSAVPAILATLTGVTRSKPTIYNWVRDGCRTTDARIVKLGASIELGQWFTTMPQIEAFIEEIG